MNYSTPNETSISRGGAAVWDIFPVTATNHLRRFLKSTSLLNIDDPVMRQQFYISTPQLEQLKDEHHIVPWRIYQNPGEAVFIPAGCAHQVCNLTSCIKVACDFVSPHCISRCRDLIEGTRRLADVRGGKKEDVLQLKAMMMCAWEEMRRWEDKASSELERK
jgi:[histone H3]-dimethyl-L-lysine9 demethylase